MIPFNKPCHTGNEEQYVLDVMRGTKLSGDGNYSKRCQLWFETKFDIPKTLLTPSCTHALELAALLLDIGPGDEVIMPSYTFVSTANAFVLRGAKIVFVDIRKDTMNIDESLIEAAITPRTKVIVPVHYAGVGCEMDTIMSIAERYGIAVVEDAAQAFMATYKGRPLGSIGHLGTFSFHDTKNYTSGGEGGLLLINDGSLASQAEIMREKGTNRSQFLRGNVDKYTWISVGSSLLPSELQAAFLWGQLEMAEKINECRLSLWRRYYAAFKELEANGMLDLQNIPSDCHHNAHMFYLKVKNMSEQTGLIKFLSENGVSAVFHYIPLHSSPAGKKFGIFNGVDVHTSKESQRLIRLPLFYGMSENDVDLVVEKVLEYFS